MKTLALAIVLLAPALARAQTCAMLPPGTPDEGPPAPPQITANAVDAVVQALVGDGITVMSSDDAQRRMTGETFAACNELECGSSVVASLGVEFVVLVTVWAPRGSPTSVVVTLIGANDSAAGDAPVQGDDVVAAALAALTTARQRWQTSQMGYLVVSTVPEGADVEVDGRLLGQAPMRRLVQAGERRVRVHLQGYRAVEQTVRVEPTGEHPLELTLAEETDAEPPPPQGSYTQPHFANYLIGGALIAAGVAALIQPFYTLALEGQCWDARDLDPGWCRSRVQFGPAGGVLLGVGGAAILGGIIFMAVQPITMTTTVTADSAMLHVFGTF